MEKPYTFKCKCKRETKQQLQMKYCLILQGLYTCHIHSLPHLSLFEALHYVTVSLSGNIQWILPLPPCGIMNAGKKKLLIDQHEVCKRDRNTCQVSRPHPYPILSLDAVSFHGHLCFELLLFQNSATHNQTAQPAHESWRHRKERTSLL